MHNLIHITRNFNVKVSAGEGKSFIRLVDTYTENTEAGTFSYYRDVDGCRGK